MQSHYNIKNANHLSHLLKTTRGKSIWEPYLPANWKFYSQSLEVCYSNTFYLMVKYFAVAKHIKWTAVSVSFTKHSTVTHNIKKMSYSPQEALDWINGVNKLSHYSAIIKMHILKCKYFITLCSIYTWIPSKQKT